LLSLVLLFLPQLVQLLLMHLILILLTIPLEMKLEHRTYLHDKRSEVL